MGRGNRKRWRVALALMGIGGLVVWMIPAPPGPLRWVPIADLAARRDEASKHDVRVQGGLVHGTLRRDQQACITHFVLRDSSDAAATVSVRYAKCAIPDRLREIPGQWSEIGAIGRLHPDGHFEAESLLTKSGGPYEMRQRVAEPGSPLTKLKELEQDPPPDIAKALRGTHAVPTGSTSHDTFSP